MKITTHIQSPRLLAVLAAVVLAVLLATPSAFGGCNKWGKGQDCSPNPNPAIPGSAVIQIDDESPCSCMGPDHPMPEMWMGPMDCESAIGISNTEGEYFCAVQPLDVVVLMTHHMSMDFNQKYAKICNSLAFNPVSVGHPDEVSFGWTEDCFDGSCAMDMNMEFSGARILDLTKGAADALSLVLHGTIETAVGGNGNPFLVPQDIDLESMDLVFLQPGSTRIAGICTIYMGGGEVLSVAPTGSD